MKHLNSNEIGDEVICLKQSYRGLNGDAKSFFEVIHE